MLFRSAVLRRPVPAGVAALVLVLGVVAVVGLVGGWPTWSLGLALGGGLLGAAYLVGQGTIGDEVEVVWPDDREPGDRPLAAAVAGHPRARRWVLGGLGLGAVSAVGLLAWIGRTPRPRTAWRAGVYLVTADGERILAADVPIGGFGTVWPEDAERADLAAVVLVRLASSEARPPTVLPWVVDERLVAYSKVCTHAGCPVGLYQETSDSLFCPCHQATFDAARGAIPVFGPAVKPLPQLPLAVDGDGYLVAAGDFSAPVGPVQA